MIIKLPNHYRVHVGDSIEIENIEYTVREIDQFFERGRWSKRVVMEHDAENCRACKRHEFCGCPPCPETLQAEWPEIIGN